MFTLEKLGSTTVYTQRGSWVVMDDGGDCLVNPIDAWGKDKPVFAHVDFSMRFSEEQAREQVNYCLWSGNKVRTKAVNLLA